MEKKRLLFAISQFYKGGAEISLLNLLRKLDQNDYEIDLLIMNQCPAEGAVSLIPELPEHIRVFDAYRKEQHSSFGGRLQRRIFFTERDRSRYPASALRFARCRRYDWAFHVGEWWLPEFVAEEIMADHKAVWIHTDIAAADSFAPDAFFASDNAFERYIFASQRSLESAAEAFPFLQKKAVCIHNISDSEGILAKSAETTELFASLPRPIVLTCANIRREKNHRRQLLAMKKLHDRGLDFTWVNIGSTADSAYTNVLRQQAAEYGLQDRFLLLGPRDNPYPYIAQADLVAVLSDYESWSMVITEALTLGVPVIATKTSGALEQIEDGVNGVLTDFDETDIAEKLGSFLAAPDALRRMREKLRGYAAKTNAGVLQSFHALLDARSAALAPGRRMLYVIDDINYCGGAHIATRSQMALLLAEGWDISVFSAVVPNVSTRCALPDVHFLSWQQCEADVLYQRRLADCLRDRRLSLRQKLLKGQMTWAAKVCKDPDTFNKYVHPQLVPLFSGYDVACVMSEGSSFRAQIADADIGRKIQYIHTDYAAWYCLSDWTREVTANDAALYARFDQIVLLSDAICDRFNAIYPSLRGKTTVNRNILLAEDIRKKAVKNSPIGAEVHFVTVGRVDSGKGYDRLLHVLETLYDEGYRFTWTIIGSGTDFSKISASFTYSRIADRVRLLGALDNPYPFVREADVFALFSHYEGLPNTIFEALILGVPVIATNVGGIASQITPGENGWLVPNSEKGIRDGLVHILMNSEEIREYKENLKDYTYDNETVKARTESILCGGSSSGQEL